MTRENKLDALYKAVNQVWRNAFSGWDWDESEQDPNRFILGETTYENGFAFFLAGCEDCYGGWIWIEYEPDEDMVGIYIKNRSVQTKLAKDLKDLFEKHSPFNMQVTYENGTKPILWREEKVKPKDFVNFFSEFKKAYAENYPLFYMFTVSAKAWYDGFCIQGSDC